ncbi:hypothetical protein AMECASPLE_027197 [Ameca splendens]|uniref:Uncharacterized protein n=1 Tax=Ameca splendens TaxID=208324 RepID=A0ABV0XU45_9TELE
MCDALLGPRCKIHQASINQMSTKGTIEPLQVGKTTAGVSLLFTCMTIGYRERGRKVTAVSTLPPDLSKLIKGCVFRVIALLEGWPLPQAINGLSDIRSLEYCFITEP